MKAQQTKHGYGASGRSRRSQPMNLLLVGSEEVSKRDDVERMCQSDRFEVLARSSSLLEALACLDSRAIDLVLLSREYRFEELTLFALDARRRGFAGLIWHTVDAPETTAVVEPQDNSPIQAGDFFIEIVSHRVWIRGVETQCSPMEFKLLKFLCRHPEELLSHRTLLESLWGNPKNSAHNLRILICGLRAKVETTASPRYIVSLRSFGYRFIPSPQPLG
jgi:DNA-binding winged helix-turn-helix (wHTH) protein